MGFKSSSYNVYNMYVGNTPVRRVFYNNKLIFVSDKGNLNDWRYSNTEISGKTLLYEYIGNDWNNTIYVPRVKGKAVVNHSYAHSGSSQNNLPFYLNTQVRSVDFQHVPFRGNIMDLAFIGCTNLTSVFNINDSVISMKATFSGCSNFNQNIKLPNSVIYLDRAFEDCSKFNQNIQIPNRTESIDGAFMGCLNFNQNLALPFGIIYLGSAFRGCRNFNQNIQIPNSVRYMAGTFRDCVKLKQNIRIPNSVSDIEETFFNCHSLKPVFIYSANCTYANNCFTTDMADGNRPVVIPSRYINNAASDTWKSLKAAGWKISNQGGMVGPTGSKILGWDMLGGDYPTYVGNGTHWILKKWSGNLSSHVGDWMYNDITNVTVPYFYETYDNFPTAITPSCFYKNGTIESLDVNQVSIDGTSAVNAFRLMKNCKAVTGVNISQGITTTHCLFYSDYNADTLSTGSYISDTGYAILPNSVTTVGGVFGQTNLSNYYVWGKGGTNLASCFAGVNRRRFNAFIEPANVTAIGSVFAKYNNNLRKNIYIHFKYRNGTATKTFNAFKSTTFMGTSGNSSFANPSYNSTTNFYFYNINPASIFSYSYRNAGARNYTYIRDYNDNSPVKCVALMTEFPDDIDNYSLEGVLNTTFRERKNVQAIDFRNVPFLKSSGAPELSLANAFRDCRRLCSITNMNTGYSSYSCVTNMDYTFYFCPSLQGRLDIRTTELASARDTFNYVFSTRNLNVFIYFKYANGAYTKTYNLVVGGEKGNSHLWNGRFRVTVCNLGKAPW